MSAGRTLTAAEFLDSGEAYGRERCAADAAIWLAKVEEVPAFAADLTAWFAYFEVKARPLALAATQARAEGVEHPAWFNAVKRGYREAVCKIVVERIQAWKKRAPRGKMHFAQTVNHMPLASQVFVFPDDPPAVDPSYRESIRIMLDGLAELAGLR